MTGTANVGIFRRLIRFQDDGLAYFLEQLRAVENAFVALQRIQKLRGEDRMLPVAGVRHRLQPAGGEDDAGTLL